MVTRRLAQVSTSDDEGAPKPSASSSDDDTNRRTRRRSSRHEPRQKRRKKLLRVTDDEDEEEEEEVEHRCKDKDEEEDEEEEEEEEPVQEDAKPIGDVIRVSGKGRGQRKHYKEFEFDGNRFELVSVLHFLFMLATWKFDCETVELCGIGRTSLCRGVFLGSLLRDFFRVRGWCLIEQ